MANSKDVELRIRARDYSQKPLKAVTAAIEAMSKAQEEQGKAAGRGEASTRALEQSYKRLEQAGQQLLRLNSLVELYKRQAESMAEASKKTEELKQKQAQLQAAYDNSTKVTKKQESALASINRQVERAQRVEASRTAQVSRTAKEMDRYGISTKQVGAAQSSIVNSVTAVNKALQQQENIIAGAPAASSAASARTRAAAEAQKQADLAASQAAQAAAAQAKVISGLQRQADQAMAAAKGYSTLGRVVQVTTGNLGPLASQIQQIVSPAEAARRTLSGLSSQVDALAREVAASGKNITDMTAKVKTLNEANRSVSALAQQIDMFRQQTAAVRAAREEYRNAMVGVQQLAQQMRTATTDTGELAARMGVAQQRLSAASKVLRDTGSAARSTQSSLRGAGVDTRNLTAEEQRLISTSQQATSTLNTLTQAVRNNAGAARDGGKAFSIFRDEGRTTLSMLQRVRGEVLALATAYVGLQGGLNLAGGAVDAYKMKQQAMVKIATVVGDNQKALGDEWAYMTGLANKLGIEIGTLSSSYTRFAVAAKAVGLSLQDSKFIFESVAKAGRVFHLSADDMNGIFRALEQMLSKGQVYAEELRGQLGERLPGAVALFAKGMNMTTQQLMKAMENGEISGEAVINFAREQAKAIDAQLATAEKGVDAMEARAKNAMTAFQLALANSGFIDAYVNLLQKVTDFLNSPDGAQAAHTLGQAFSSAADAVVYLIDNIDGLITVLEILVGLKAAKMVLGMVGAVRTAIPEIKKVIGVIQAVVGALSAWATSMASAGGAIGALGVALRVLLRAIPLVGTALIAYDIGSILYDQSQTAREAINAVIRDYKNLGNQLVAIAESIPSAIYDLNIAIIRPVTTLFSDSIKRVGGWVSDLLSIIPGVGDDLSEWSKQLVDDLTKDPRDFFESTGKIWDDVNQKWVDLNDEMVRKNKGSMAQVTAYVAGVAGAIAQLGNQAQFNFTADPESGITQRDRDIQGMTKDLTKMETAAKKADVAAQKALQRKNLPGRLKIIDDEFAPQYARAKSIGGDEGAALQKRLDAVVAQRKKAETDSYNAMAANSNKGASAAKKQENAITSLTAQYQKLNDAVGVKEAKVDPAASFDDRLQAKLQAVNTQYDQLIQKANKLGTPGKQLAGQFEDLRKRNLEYTTTQTKLEEIKRVEDQLNATQETKKNLLDEINAKRQAGIISEDEAVRQTTELYQNMNASLGQSATSLEQLATSFRNVMSPEAYAELMAKIAQIKASMQDLTGTFTEMDTMKVQGVLDGVSTGLTSAKDQIVGLITGTEDLGDAFRNLGATVANFFADFMMKIAQAIIQQMILNALAGSGGGIGSAAVSLGGKVASKHNGGTIGSKTTSGQQRKNAVSPSLFIGAPRFHDGGLPGLKSDEVPIIAQKGEQILSKDDPNNIMNQGSGGGSGASNPQDIRVINAIDSASVVAAGLNAPENSKVILNYIKANKQAVKQVLG